MLLIAAVRIHINISLYRENRDLEVGDKSNVKCERQAGSDLQIDITGLQNIHTGQSLLNLTTTQHFMTFCIAL